MSSSCRFIVSISLVYWLIASYNSHSLDALHSLYQTIFLGGCVSTPTEIAFRRTTVITLCL